jgi:hypothetical protein
MKTLPRPLIGSRPRLLVLAAACVLGTLTGTARAELVIEGGGPVVAPAAIRRAAVKPADAEDEKKETAPAAPVLDGIRFANGDTLHGNLVGIEPSKGLRWKSPETATDIVFSMTNIQRVTLVQTKRSSPTNQNGLCVARLTNGDELAGVLAGVNTNTVLLETWYAGTLSLQRKMVASVRFIKQGLGVVFEGPTSMEGWTSRGNRAAWKYADGAFSASRPGSIGRDVKLPGQAHLELDLSWRGQLQFLLNIYTDGFEEYGNNTYMLQMNSGYVYLQRVRRNGGSSNLGQAEVPNLTRQNKTHLDIFVNKEQRTIALVLDGALVKQWKDAAEFAGLGTGVLFYNQGVNPIKVGNVKVTEWDGKMDTVGSAPVKSKEDAVELLNRDKISGVLEEIKDGKMIFNTAFANMTIPIDRLQGIDFSADKSAEAEKKPGDIRAIFAERGSVTLQLEKWTPQEVTGSNPNFGAIRLKTSAFSQIQFNVEQIRKTEAEIQEPMDEGEQ